MPEQPLTSVAKPSGKNLKESSRLYYIANARVPSEKAHVLQIFNMCHAFAEEGCRVTLVCPRRRNNRAMSDVADVWEYYDVGHNFTIERLPSWDCPSLGVLSKGLRYRLQALSFAAAVARYIPPRASGALVYSRDLYSTLFLLRATARKRFALVFEAHLRPRGWAAGLLARWGAKLDGLVVINSWLKKKWRERGVPAGKTMVAHDGVNLHSFRFPKSRGEIRHRLRLNERERAILYAGHLYPWKGVYTLAEAVRWLPPHYRVYFLGGTIEDRAGLRDYCRRKGLPAVFLEHAPPAAVADYLFAADVLVLPNSGSDERSRRASSPLKLFEYLAAGKPIVAADVPALREVVREGRDVLFFIPDDPSSLAKQIKSVLADEGLAKGLARSALRLAKNFSWQKRASRIVNFLAPRCRTAIGNAIKER